jgi:hypothetical protein
MSDVTLDQRYIDLDGDGKVHYLNHHEAVYRNKMTAFYGETGTGKSVLIRQALYTLRHRRALIVVISPTARSNGIYDGIVENLLIHPSPTEELLERIYKRQTEVSEIYLVVNKLENLKMVFDLCRDMQAQNKEQYIIKSSDQAFQSARMITHVKQRDDEMKKITSIKLEKLIELYKSVIAANGENLIRITQVSEPQRLIIYKVVKYLFLNPELILILDDCAAEFKKLAKTEVMKKMFYQGRNENMTTMISFQSPNDLPNELRRNAHNSFFTTAESAQYYFNTSTNGKTKQAKTKWEKIINKVFYDATYSEYHKIGFIRGVADPFRVVLAKVHDKFEAYDPAVKKFLSSIKLKVKTHEQVF